MHSINLITIIPYRLFIINLFLFIFSTACKHRHFWAFVCVLQVPRCFTTSLFLIFCKTAKICQKRYDFPLHFLPKRRQIICRNASKADLFRRAMNKIKVFENDINLTRLCVCHQGSDFSIFNTDSWKLTFTTVIWMLSPGTMGRLGKMKLTFLPTISWSIMVTVQKAGQEQVLNKPFWIGWLKCRVTGGLTG